MFPHSIPLPDWPENMFPHSILLRDWPENGFSGPILAYIDHVFGTVSLNSVVPPKHNSPTLWITAAAATLGLTLVSWLSYSKKKKKTSACGRTTFTSLIGMTSSKSTEPDNTLWNDDARYAEQLQFEEALLASLSTSQMAHNASLSIQGRPMLKMEKTEIQADEHSECFCEICLENKEIWQMFRNASCSHSFCYDCTSKHIVAKLQENMSKVMCPAVNCNTALDANACRLMFSDDILVRWDESLCMSLIVESQKLYCPYRDCSTMLVNDSGEIIREVICPVCKRSFCALCRIPWHSEFTCMEYQKVNARKGKGDEMVKLLAKKKSWQKCPRCKVYIEKTEGCIHMTCRCRYEFCYRCGSKWSGAHSVCHQRS